MGAITMVGIRMCIILAVALAFCRGEEKSRVDSAQVKSILIVMGDSDFELDVIDIVQEELEFRGYRIKKSDIDFFKDEQITLYEAVVILNAVKQKKLKSPVQKYLEGVKDGEWETIVIVTTVGNNQLSQQDSRVHAISSASIDYKAEVVANNVLHRIEQILQKSMREKE
jgi:hypothetical protein